MLNGSQPEWSNCTFQQLQAGTCLEGEQIDETNASSPRSVAQDVSKSQVGTRQRMEEMVDQESMH